MLAHAHTHTQMQKEKTLLLSAAGYIPSPLPHVLVALIQQAVVTQAAILAFRRLTQENYYELKISLVTLRLAWALQGNPDSDNSNKRSSCHHLPF